MLIIFSFGYGSIPINTIFSGMNIHLPAILGFTRYQDFDPSPFSQWQNRQLRHVRTEHFSNCSDGQAGAPKHSRRVSKRANIDETAGWAATGCEDFGTRDKPRT